MKQVFILTCALLLAITGLQAQQLPINIDFTDDMGGMTLIQDDQPNYWMRGDLGAYDGTCLHITSIYASGYRYRGDYSVSHAVKPINFDGERDVDLKFQWMARGRTDGDAVEVFLLPSDINIEAGSQFSDHYCVGKYYGEGTVQEVTINLGKKITQDEMNLVFTWVNLRDNYVGDEHKPGSIDNISVAIPEYTINYHTDEEHTNPLTYNRETETFTLKPLTANWINFLGWYDNPEFTGNPVTEIPQGTTGNIELWANMELKDGYGLKTTQISPVADAFTYYSDAHAARANTNYGTSTGINVRKFSGGKFRGYIKFELPEQVEANDIVSAKLHLNNNGHNHEGNTAFRVYQCDKNWIETGEGGITWNNSPDYDADKYASVAKHTDQKQSYEIDVTSLIEDNENNTIVTSMMMDILNKGSENRLYFGSKENENEAYRPLLEISYYGSIEYSLTYHGGTSTNPLIYTTESETITLTDPTNDGYTTFEGWYDNAEFTGNVITEIPTGSTGDKELWAKWTPIEYSITYNLNGGATTNRPTYNVESETIVLAEATTTKQGYVFEGWYDNAEFTGIAVTEIAKGSTGNVELWAKFVTAEYTITYNLGGGAATNPPTYTIESETITLSDATADWGNFMGWYDNPEFTGNAITEIPQGSTGDIELWAKFEMKDGHGVIQLPVIKDATIAMKEGGSDRAKQNNGGRNVMWVYDSMYSERDFSKVMIDFGTLDLPLEYIQSATLKLHHDGHETAIHGGNNDFNIYPYNKEWNEMTVTWDNTNASIDLTGDKKVYVPESEDGIQSYTIDVLPVLEASGNQTLTGMVFHLANGASGSKEMVRLASKENADASRHPVLEIEFNKKPTAIEPDATQSAIILYPNPATTYFTVESQEATGRVSVYGLSGALVLSQPLTQTTQRVDIPQLTKGIYLVKVETVKTTKTTKLIVR